MTTRRNLAAVALALGTSVSLLGGGIFAVFTDRATTGQNDASTRAEARAADVRLATAVFAGGVYQCGAFVDDLATGVISATDLAPDFGTGTRLCLRNEGSAPVSAAWSVIELVDLDVACTGDEAAAGDATCGGNQLGEASGALRTFIGRQDCGTDSPLASFATTLASAAQGPTALPGDAPLAPGETACIALTVSYTPDGAQQLTQSDKATWRYAFDVTTTT
jgi:hypothetical protein